MPSPPEMTSMLASDACPGCALQQSSDPRRALPREDVGLCLALALVATRGMSRVRGSLCSKHTRMVDALEVSTRAAAGAPAHAEQ